MARGKRKTKEKWKQLKKCQQARRHRLVRRCQLMVNQLPVLLVLLGSALGALAAFFVKLGMNTFNFRALFRNTNLLQGIALYAVSALIYIVALKGGELSVLFPLASTSYIWSSFLSVRFLKEKMNLWKWLSISGIIIGVFFIGLGS